MDRLFIAYTKTTWTDVLFQVISTDEAIPCELHHSMQGSLVLGQTANPFEHQVFKIEPKDNSSLSFLMQRTKVDHSRSIYIQYHNRAGQKKHIHMYIVYPSARLLSDSGFILIWYRYHPRSRKLMRQVVKGAKRLTYSCDKNSGRGPFFKRKERCDVRSWVSVIVVCPESREVCS